jgi:hypothetical protein
MKNLLDISCV